MAIGSRHTRRWSLQVNPLNTMPDVVAITDEIHEVLPSALRFGLQLARLILLALQALDAMP